MKKQSIIKLFALLLIYCAMFGCGKDNKLGSIYGTVTDFATGEPVGNANVRLNPRGETTLTGSDGTFQFNDLPDGSYSLSLSKNGYVDLDDDYVIEIENGNSVRHDVQLNHAYISFIVTLNGVEVNEFDFGSDPSFNKITARVVNNGTLKTDISSDNISSSSDWIEQSFHGGGGTLYPNDGKSLDIEIIRSRLQPGENTGYLFVNIGSISKTIVVRAVR